MTPSGLLTLAVSCQCTAWRNTGARAGSIARAASGSSLYHSESAFVATAPERDLAANLNLSFRVIGWQGRHEGALLTLAERAGELAFDSIGVGEQPP